MVSYPQTDMKIPVRPAPAPPANKPNRTFQRSSSFFDSWDDGNDPFSNGNISRSISAQHIGPVQAVRKKPPPRPPPPKFNISSNNNKNVRQNKTNVLSGLFSRSSRHPHSTNTPSHKNITAKDHNIMIGSLIDFDSPSSSPTFTTRSSSDGVSVNSFGSDGSASNNGNTPSGGTASLFESGFEDDFDFFGGLSNNHVKTPVSEQKDPWSMSPQDPFSPPRQRQQEPPSNSGSTTWFSDLPGSQNKPTGALKPPPVTSAMPTIIRAKPSRPSAPPKLVQSMQPSKDSMKLAKETSVQNSLSHQNVDTFDSSKVFSCGSGDAFREWSPPMPSIPPPPPPENVNSDSDVPITLPDLPPRNFLMSNKKMPQGIALYDYSTSHPDDLSFKCNDIIHLLKKINNDWLYGEIGGRHGMFPANFVEVIIPLDRTGDSSEQITVTALYSFSAQQWEDLEFPEGAVIHVLGQINVDWLYGEYQGKKGQFPSTFVDRVPPGLPQQMS